MSMRLAILGSGSAVPDPERGNPSQAIIIDNTTLLFDCWERTTVNLIRAGINPLDVDVLKRDLIELIEQTCDVANHDHSPIAAVTRSSIFFRASSC